MTRQDSSIGIRRSRTGWLWLAGSLACLLINTTLRAQTVDLSGAGPLPRCGTVEHERILQQRNPDRPRQLNELNRRIEQAEASAKGLRQAVDDVIYRIPVVVHVVHNTASGAIGGANNVNISDEQIISQIQVLNEDYRRKPGTNGYNTSPIGADAQIEFFLATTDPAGRPTDGITRHYYDRKTLSADKKDAFTLEDDTLLARIAYWPSDRYLNIWVTRFADYLGYTQFPTAADTLRGLYAQSNEFTDGSIIDYRYFGRQTGAVTNRTYDLGRTVTHEIGHWLGLLHPNGDTVCGDDYVADTPPTDDLNQTVNCRDLYSNCSGKRTRELIENYMMYSPDACMNMFTAGQVGRMRKVLLASPRRARLIRSVMSPLTESETLTLSVYPNPVRTDPTIDVQLKGFQSFTVELFDLTGQQLVLRQYTDAPSTRLTLPLNGLAAGVYVVRVKTDAEMASKRLLVP